MLLVLAVHRQREQVPVSVRVHVAGRVDEVPDVRPPDAVVVVHVHAVAEQVGLGAEPELGEAVDGQLAGAAALAVDGVLEAVHRDLPEDGGHRAVERAREQVERSAGPGARSSRRSSTMFSPKIDAVSASVSGS